MEADALASELTDTGRGGGMVEIMGGDEGENINSDGIQSEVASTEPGSAKQEERVGKFVNR